MIFMIVDRAGQWDVSFDPFSIAEMLYAGIDFPAPEEPTQIYDYFEPLFLFAVESLRHLGENVKVEFNIDDCCSTLEEIRFSDKVVLQDVQRPVEFPRVYDRIHLNNIP